MTHRTDAAAIQRLGWIVRVVQALDSSPSHRTAKRRLGQLTRSVNTPTHLTDRSETSREPRGKFVLGLWARKGTEFILTPFRGDFLTGEAVAAFDADAARVREALRPFRDPSGGYVPPHVGRLMVNLGIGPDQDAMLLDPLCGQGGLILEAAAMGMDVTGSDKDPLRVEQAITNLAWLGVPQPRVSIRDLHEGPPISVTSSTVVVTEVIPGVQGSVAELDAQGEDELAKQIAQMVSALLSWPIGRAVIALPFARSLRQRIKELTHDEWTLEPQWRRGIAVGARLLVSFQRKPSAGQSD